MAHEDHMVQRQISDVIKKRLPISLNLCWFHTFSVDLLQMAWGVEVTVATFNGSEITVCLDMSHNTVSFTLTPLQTLCFLSNVQCSILHLHMWSHLTGHKIFFFPSFGPTFVNVQERYKTYNVESGNFSRCAASKKKFTKMGPLGLQWHCIGITPRTDKLG